MNSILLNKFSFDHILRFDKNKIWTAVFAKMPLMKGSNISQKFHRNFTDIINPNQVIYEYDFKDK